MAAALMARRRDRFINVESSLAIAGRTLKQQIRSFHVHYRDASGRIQLIEFIGFKSLDSDEKLFQEMHHCNSMCFAMSDLDSRKLPMRLVNS